MLRSILFAVACLASSVAFGGIFDDVPVSADSAIFNAKIAAIPREGEWPDASEESWRRDRRHAEVALSHPGRSGDGVAEITILGRREATKEVFVQLGEKKVIWPCRPQIFQNLRLGKDGSPMTYTVILRSDTHRGSAILLVRTSEQK